MIRVCDGENRRYRMELEYPYTWVAPPAVEVPRLVMKSLKRSA